MRIDDLGAAWVLDGPMNRTAFDTDIETQLAPTRQPGDAVIADNLSSPKSARAQAILKAQGRRLLFPPPYGPDLNPIEMAVPNPKRTYDAARRGHSMRSSTLSHNHANSSHQSSAEPS